MKVIRIGKDDKFPIEPCDLVVCKAYPYTLTKAQLEHPRIGCINIHSSLLPKYRGRHPIVWAMINQEKEIGVTIHWMSDGIDEGDIIMQVGTPLTVNNTYPEMKDRLDYIGEVMLLQVLKEFEAGKFERIPQDHEAATYWPRRQPCDSEIKLRDKMDARQMTAFINALAHPMPNAFIKDNAGHRISFMGARYEE